MLRKPGGCCRSAVPEAAKGREREDDAAKKLGFGESARISLFLFAHVAAADAKGRDCYCCCCSADCDR